MLTAKQHQVYQFICAYMKQHAYAPTAAEIGAGVGVQSRGVIHRYLKALNMVGLIELIPGRRRNIVLCDVDDEDSSGSLPLLGNIAAGQPIEVIEHDQSLDVMHAILRPERFGLRVRGDSMLGDNICDGDYIICEKRVSVASHEIAVVLVDAQEATLKRLHVNGDGTVTLLPSNPAFSPLVYQEDQIHIQGVYIGLLRLPI